jgi:ectoine hydroxylase-related dioxygenase (phytanoyl-CoA dioxygenase family)
VGEIDPAILTTKPEIICPVLAPGDVVLMHSALWHESGPRVTGPDRVLADIIYQRADDPARALPREGIFVRSRSSRLRELQAQVDAKV